MSHLASEVDNHSYIAVAELFPVEYVSSASSDGGSQRAHIPKPTHNYVNHSSTSCIPIKLLIEVLVSGRIVRHAE
jgi:hypothetical protein